MNADLLDLVVAFVNDRGVRERMGYDVDTCIKRRIKPIPLPSFVYGAHLSIMWRERRNAFIKSIAYNCIEISILDNINGIVVKLTRTFQPWFGSMTVTTGVMYSPARSTEDRSFVVGTSPECVYRNTYWDEKNNVYHLSACRYARFGLLQVNYIRYKLE